MSLQIVRRRTEQEPPEIKRMADRSWKVPHQYVAFAVLSIAVVGMAAILIPSSNTYFRSYFGNINPILGVVLAAAVGGGSLGLLRSYAKLEILRGRRTLRGIAVSAGIATLLAVSVIIADLFIRYPEDTNVPVPEALLFYPVMGFVAEMIFHVMPLALLLLVLSPFRKRLGTDNYIRIGIIIAAIAEPTFQVVLAGTAMSLALVYTWVHICVFAFPQLWVFRRYDFVAMYSFRLVYYAYWHIAWGVIRLEVLF